MSASKKKAPKSVPSPTRQLPHNTNNNNNNDNSIASGDTANTGNIGQQIPPQIQMISNAKNSNIKFPIQDQQQQAQQTQQTQQGASKSPRKSHTSNGRRKIVIKPIMHEATRRATFEKRRIGLLKKAMELSILCSSTVAVTIYTPAGDVYIYSSEPYENVIHKFQKYNGPYRLLTNDHLPEMVPGKAKSSSVGYEILKQPTGSDGAGNEANNGTNQIKPEVTGNLHGISNNMLFQSSPLLGATNMHFNGFPSFPATDLGVQNPNFGVTNMLQMNSFQPQSTMMPLSGMQPHPATQQMQNLQSHPRGSLSSQSHTNSSLTVSNHSNSISNSGTIDKKNDLVNPGQNQNQNQLSNIQNQPLNSGTNATGKKRSFTDYASDLMQQHTQQQQHLALLGSNNGYVTGLPMPPPNKRLFGEPRIRGLSGNSNDFTNSIEFLRTGLLISEPNTLEFDTKKLLNPSEIKAENNNNSNENQTDLNGDTTIPDVNVNANVNTNANANQNESQTGVTQPKIEKVSPAKVGN